MAGFEPRVLGRTGLQVGPLGVAPSYGAPAEAFEAAFERGCNYFYWGARRTEAMARAIRNLCGRGLRSELVVVVQSYARSGALMELLFKRGLARLGLDSADVLLLGWHGKPPSARLLDRALSMKQRGLFRFLGLSGHHRPLFARLARDGVYDLFHVRYNAAHRGAEAEVFAPLEGDSRPGLVAFTATRWRRLLDPRKMPSGEPPLSAADCYRFVLSHPMVDVCMTGPRNTAQMHEALKALELGPLGPDELERIRRIGGHVHGRTDWRP
ncbi:MAG: aldo/keto reductase [Proteobacteria bacterium]|nr:aldo/keto reductase [Pseudomonadota bacterium]